RNRVIRRGWRGETDAAQADVVEVADDPVPVAAETQRITVQVPDDRGPAHRDKTLNHDGEDVLAAHQPAVKERQAGSHKHDQAGAKNHEAGITGVKVKHESLRK